MNLTKGSIALPRISDRTTMLAREAEFGTQRQCARIKMPANGGHFRENMPSDLSVQTGWLGREDSNLRMAESKSVTRRPPWLDSYFSHHIEVKRETLLLTAPKGRLFH